MPRVAQLEGVARGSGWLHGLVSHRTFAERIRDWRCFSLARAAEGGEERLLRVPWS